MQRRFFKSEVNSTSIWAREAILAKTAKFGDLFVTDFQTAGRGRLDHTWESPKGKNLLFSFLDQPTQLPEKNFQLVLVAGVALAQALEDVTQLKIDLKWPNDLFANGKKLGGILCEKIEDWIIIGVGINVNSTDKDFSPKILATSLLIETKQIQDREKILEQSMESYKKFRKIYDNEGLESILKSWDARSILHHARVRIVEENGGYEGTVQGLDEDGFLLVEENGIRRTVISGDVLLCC